ncbi:peptidase [Streptomyces sp. BBFR2]|uniref:peptidase n=1 Tax=Streptomyces sp. BBFR2 TaxID=3372854 RepID=UPI0037DA0C9D
MSDTQDPSAPGETPADGTADGTFEARAASAATYPLVPGYRVNVRQGPSTATAVIRRLPAGSYVQIRCQRHGQRVSGPTGVSDIWDAIGGGGYVSDSYVRTGSSGFVAPRCAS